MVGHGSKLEFNKNLVVSAAEKMARMNEFGPVTAAFMQLNPPDIRTGIRTLVAQGVDTIYVQPCFLASGIHLTEDIPGEIGLAKGDDATTMDVDGRTVRLLYSEPIGDDDRIAAILADRVRARAKKG